jgi:hypothetical protein
MSPETPDILIAVLLDVHCIVGVVILVEAIKLADVSELTLTRFRLESSTRALEAEAVPGTDPCK